MRTTALEFAARRRLGSAELGPPPDPGPAQVLIATRYTGITNGTERHAFLVEHGYGGGHFPSRHGYQHVGEVVAVGAEVTRYRPGDTVFLGEYVGHRGWNLVDERALMIRIAPDTDPRYCALFGVAGVAMRAVRRMGVTVGSRVWVAGQGPIGHFVGQAARCAGARVVVTDVLPRRLEAARKCGAHLVLDAGAEGTLAALKEAGPFDFIYDACSAEQLFDDVARHALLRHGGTLGAIAVRDQLSLPWSLLHGAEARVEVSCHFSHDDLEALLFLYRQGAVHVAPMVSHCASIDDAPAIYEALAAGPDELLGVIFDWADEQVIGDR